MGKKGQPVNHAAMDAKRQLAKRLLDQGLPPRMVARQLGASTTWIYKVRQEFQGTIGWNGMERRSGIDHRQGQNPSAPWTSWERRSGRERRKHPR